MGGSAADVVKAVRAAGLQGVIAKRKDSTYQPGERSADWVKLKLERQQVRGTCDCRVRILAAALKSFCCVRGRLNFG
jgi:ATP-dependent DNA ligase